MIAHGLPVCNLWSRLFRVTWSFVCCLGQLGSLGICCVFNLVIIKMSAILRVGSCYKERNKSVQMVTYCYHWWKWEAVMEFVCERFSRFSLWIRTPCMQTVLGRGGIRRPARLSSALTLGWPLDVFQWPFGDVKYIHDVPPSHFQNVCIFASRNSACQPVSPHLSPPSLG